MHWHSKELANVDYVKFKLWTRSSDVVFLIMIKKLSHKVYGMCLHSKMCAIQLHVPRSYVTTSLAISNTGRPRKKKRWGKGPQCHNFMKRFWIIFLCIHKSQLFIVHILKELLKLSLKRKALRFPFVYGLYSKWLWTSRKPIGKHHFYSICHNSAILQVIQNI